MRKRKRDLFGEVFPGPVLDRSAPFWHGDTAELVIEKRLADRAIADASKRRRSPRSQISGPPDIVKTIRRLERNLPRRKTLAARQRIEARLLELRQSLTGAK